MNTPRVDETTATVRLAVAKAIEGEPDQVWLCLVIDGKELDVRLSRQMAASLVAVLASAMAG
jgi:hypothetical protein